MNVLGASIGIDRGSFTIANTVTQDRIDRMRLILDNLLEVGVWSDNQAAALAGRATNPAKSDITGVECACYSMYDPHPGVFGVGSAEGCEFQCTPPSSGAPHVLYTDGAVEGLEVPGPVLQNWSNSGTRHAVMQSELCPVAVSRLTGHRRWRTGTSSTSLTARLSRASRRY
eukprot:2210062-Amphidinium_carterae.2